MNRRGFLSGTVLLSGSLQFALGASDFWNKKDPANWTGDDIRNLTTRSPWAKDVAVISRTEAHEAYPGSSPTGSGLPGDPAMTAGGQPGGARMNIPIGGDAAQGGDGRRGVRQPPTVTVRWESAQPIRDALKNSIPSDFDQHYVIAVSGVLIPLADKQGLLEQMKASASLQAKGKERVQPGVVRYSKDGSTILFGFLKDLLSLTAADKDVQFSVNTGDLILHARFDPKEMMYHGQLAV